MSGDVQPLVSVITPAYNEAAHIGQCIESVLAQTYTRWNYTIVNNSSTDQTLEIAERYAQRDPRVRVITTPEFYNQIKNHNFAIQHLSADCKYCKLVLGDSWIFPDCLAKMVEAAEGQPTVGIVGALWFNSSHVPARTLPYPSLLVPGREMCRIQLLGDEDYFGSPTALLLRADLVRKRDPFFPEGARSFDTEACFEVLKESDFSFLHQLLSFNRTDNVSVSTLARRFAPYTLNQLIHVRRFGHHFLTPQEVVRVRRLFDWRYYDFLAAQALRGAGREFWAYHRSQLATVGEKLSRLRLTGHVMLELADMALNPKNTLMRIARHLGRRVSGARSSGTRSCPSS